jgi:Protein of unknown function (DUF4232)
MTTESTHDDRLDAFIKDGPTNAPSHVLDGVLAAFPTTPQRRRALRLPWRTSSVNPFTRVLAGAAVVVAFGVAVLFVASRPTPDDPGGVGSSPSGVVALPTPSATPAVTPSASAPAATPSPTAIASPGPCAAADVAARITVWEGAAGHRIANVELTNAGPDPCVIESNAKPQLVEGTGSVLIDGVEPPASTAVTLAPGAVLTTLVQDANYCGPAPVAPVTVAFVQTDGPRILASPVSPTDATVPPCNGPAGSPGDIEMQPWAASSP